MKSLVLALAALLVALLMGGCGTNSTPTSNLTGLQPVVSTTPSVTKQLFRGGPDSGSLAGQTIPAIPGLSLRLYAYSETGFGAELPSNSMAARYEIPDGTWFAPSIGQTRGGPSNKTNTYYVQKTDDSSANPQPEIAASDSSFKLLPGDYVVWCSLYWNGQSVDVGTPLRVNADPNRPKLQMTIYVSDMASGAKKVRLIATNLQPATTAPDTKVFASFNGNILSAWATCDYAGGVKSGTATLTFAGKATLVPGSVRVIETLGRGGPVDSDFENDPSSLTTGVRVGNLSPNGDKAVTFEVTTGVSLPKVTLETVKTADPDMFFSVTTTLMNNSDLAMPWVVLKSQLNGQALTFTTDGATPTVFDIPAGWEIRPGSTWMMTSDPSYKGWVWTTSLQSVNLGSVPAKGWAKVKFKISPITAATVSVYAVNANGTLGAELTSTATGYRYLIDGQKYKVVAHMAGKADADIVCSLGNRYNADFPVRTTAWLSGNIFWCVGPGCNEIFVTVYDKTTMTKLAECWFPVLVPTPDDGGLG